MNGTNVKIRTDKELKNEVSKIYAKPDEPNEVTASAIAEENRIADDQNVKGYQDIAGLRKSLDKV